MTWAATLRASMFGIGMTEMVVIAVIALIVLGPKRLPELARTLGRTLAEFRRSATDLRREFSGVMDETRIDPPVLPPKKPEPQASATAPEPPGAEAAAGEPGADPGRPDGSSGG